MPPRGYALVFFFWALLAIITPTLVVWSASAKQEATNDAKVSRRTTGITENGQSKNTTARTMNGTSTKTSASCSSFDRE
ncbi:hypothetical protein OPV22_027797 [Ensete ventricosum]|uniref:Secreted protein n=1 Tax=Ensete ventricosum TaxID=4639 RepID=A0AAV8Q8M9_ENSVE|nr:hypothetical protein OPV22_027797 [Ensete ventricosum]